MADGGKQTTHAAKPAAAPARAPVSAAVGAAVSAPASTSDGAPRLRTADNQAMQNGGGAAVPWPSGLQVLAGVAAPGGRPGARAAARADRVEFRDIDPPPFLQRHELAHVIQSRRGRVSGSRDGRGQLETEAERLSAGGLAPGSVLGRADDGWLFDDPPAPATELRLALLGTLIVPRNPERALRVLRENAAPERMAALRLSYGPTFFSDLQSGLDGGQWGEARAYLGAQLTLAELIRTHTGSVWDNVAGILDALNRWPDDDVLRMVEEDVAATSLPEPPARDTPPDREPPPTPNRATWSEVQAALAAALDADQRYQATQLLLSKAERARATRGPAEDRPADAVSAQRARFAFSRIELADDEDRPNDAFLALADLNAPQRALIAPMLGARRWENLAAESAELQRIAAMTEDRAALAAALGAGTRRPARGDVSPSMLRHAAGRAGEMVSRARASADASGLTAEERARREQDVAALEALFHDRGLANAIYFSAPDVGRDTLTALGLPPHRVAQLTVNRVSSFEELLALVRSVPPERRLEIPNSDPNSNDDHDSIWVQAKLHQLGVLNDPHRMEVFNAAIYEGRRELAGSAVGSSMQALLDAHDVERLWDADRPSVAVSFINRLPEERRVALAGHERMSALVARLRAGRVVEMLRSQQLRRALDGEAAAVLGEMARTLTVRGGRPAVVIDDERALVEAANQNPLSQSEMRRAFVLWNRRREDPSLRLTDEESALVTRYEALARDTEAMDDPAMAEALRAATFGEPNLTGNAPGPQNPGSEAEFMHFRLEARARAARGSGSDTFDTFNWEGTTVDERLTEFRQYYAAQRPAGFGQAEYAVLADLYFRAMTAIDAYVPANRAFASQAAMMAGAVVGSVVVTVLSGGTLGPVAVGAIASMAGGASAGITGYAIRGESSAADIGTDVATGAVEGALAVAGSALAARVVHGAAIGRPAGQAVRMAGGNAVRSATGGAGATIAEGIIDGAIGGAGGELFQTVLDETTWNRGVASAFAALMAAIVRGGAMGAGGGLIGGAIGVAVRRVFTDAASAEARQLGRLLQHAGVADPAALSEGALQGIVAAQRLADAGDVDGALGALRLVQELSAADREALESAMRRLHLVRSAIDVGADSAEADRLAAKMTELDDVEFARHASDPDAHAVIHFENGEPRILVRRGSPPWAVREEIEHLMQWQTDPLMRMRMAEVAAVTDEGWRGMAAAERARVAREALLVEADAQRRILSRVEERATSGDPLASEEWFAADAALFDINQRLDALDAALATPDNIDLRALGLDGATPPRFYASRRQAPIRPAAAAPAASRFLGRRIDAPNLAEALSTAGYVVHRRNGRIFRIERHAERGAALPHLTVDEGGLIAAGVPGRRNVAEMRADAERAWLADQQRLASTRANVAAGRLSGKALEDANLSLQRSPFREELERLVAAGQLDAGDAGLLQSWAPFANDLANRRGFDSPARLRAVAGLPRTPGDVNSSTLSTFRGALRDEAADHLLSISDGALRMRTFHAMLSHLDSGSRGAMFTTLRRRLWEVPGSGVTPVMDGGRRVTPDFEFDFMGPGGQRADDLVEVAAGHPDLPAGRRVAIEDKTGPGAFRLDQAQGYARAASSEAGRGLRRSTSAAAASDYDAMVYVFSDGNAAERAYTAMYNDDIVRPILGRARGGIHVRYYDANGVMRPWPAAGSVK